MRVVPTSFDNYQYLIDDLGIVAGIIKDEKLIFKLHDTVYVTADHKGYIGEGIHDGGYGIIELIIQDDSDYFFGVRMIKSGEYGFVKDTRLSWISSRYEFRLPD